MFRGVLWALFEFWKDEVETHMDVVREFVDPIVERAVEKKKQGKMEKDVNAAEEQTLLSHMVSLTDGTYYFIIHIRMYLSEGTIHPHPVCRV